jgi:hypothetical protein
MTGRGFQVVAVSASPRRRLPWTARISAGPPALASTYVGLFGENCADVRWVGWWSRETGYVVYDSPGEGWRATEADRVLYEQRDLYELAKDDAVMLTEAQATGLAVLAGRRLPTDTELTAAIRAQDEALDLRRQRWQRFYQHRADLHAADIQRLRAQAARLADAEPRRQPVSSWQERDQTVAAIPALQARLGDTFSLLRFLVGTFHDRDRGGRGYGSYTVFCNRLEVIGAGGGTIGLTLELMVRGGLLVHGPAYTPYCPAEADYTDDPDLDLAPSGHHLPDALYCAVFPASPANLEIWAIPASYRSASPILRQLSIAVTGSVASADRIIRQG